MGLLDQLQLLADKVVLLLVVLPFCGAISMALLKRQGMDAARKTALINVSLSVLLTLVMVGRFVPGGTGRAPLSQLVVSVPWVAAGAEGAAEIHATFGVDGAGLWLAALVPLVVWCLLVSEWEQWATPGQLGWLLAAEGCVLMVFAARDVALLAAALGAVALVLPLAVGAIGGEGRRAASRRLMLHQLTASTLVTAGLAGTVVCHALMRGAPRAPPGPPSFDLDGLITGIRELAALSPPAALVWTQLSPWLFVCLAAGFTLWAGIFPFHAPAAAAQSRSSAAGQVLVGALGLKIGGYGLVRLVLPLFPELCASIGAVLFLAAIWGSFCVACWLHAEDQPSRIAAGTASIGSGACLAGILSMTSSGLRGGVLILIGQALSLSLYALLAGMRARRVIPVGPTMNAAPEGATGRSGKPGLCETPRLRAAWTFCRLSLAGIPGLAMFPGLLLVVMGLVDSSREFVGGWLIAVLVLWLVLALAGGAVLRTNDVAEFARTRGAAVDPNSGEFGCAGEQPCGQNRATDLTMRELAAILPLIVASLWLGLAPQYVLDRVDPVLSWLTPGIVGRETP
jgi:NADH-quinone oxidoreductase subunit M